MVGQINFQKEMNEALEGMMIKDEGEMRFQSFEGVEFSNLAFKTSFFGTIWATNFRLIFVSAESPHIKDPEWHSSIPYTSIDKLDKKKSKNALVVEGKDVRTVKYRFQSDEQRKAFMTCLSLFPPRKMVTKDKLFAWSQTPKTKRFRPYTVNKDWDRFAAKYSAFEKNWRITNVNEKYEVCDSYPPLFIVPRYTSDDQLREVAGARSKGRLPILSYVHGSGAAIVRCAQPLSGMLQNKSTADIQMIKDFLKTNPSSNPSLVIADARPKLNAAANRAAGAGYEKASHYPNTTLDFLDIENIHVMRGAYKAFKDCCFDTVNEDRNAWLTAVENTQWLLHISRILSGAMHVVSAILNDSNVLIHCSDGWDRTSQLAGISMIILDPFYRTITGFLSLIEKEWLQAGHKFDDRVHDTGSSENSPVFLQFLECVWQIMQQRPIFFEFGESLLLDLANSLFSCRFGTFLYNCERERQNHHQKESTTCLWTTINQRRQGYINKTYNSTVDSVLGIQTQLKHMRIWRGYYFRLIVNLSDFSLEKVTTKPKPPDPQKEINSKDEYISCLLSLLKDHNIPHPAPPPFSPSSSSSSSFTSSSSSFPLAPFGDYPLEKKYSEQQKKLRNSSLPSSLNLSLTLSHSSSHSHSSHSSSPSFPPPPPPQPLSSPPASSPRSLSPSPLSSSASSSVRKFSPVRPRPSRRGTHTEDDRPLSPARHREGAQGPKKRSPSPRIMAPPGVFDDGREDSSFVPSRPSRSSPHSSSTPHSLPRDTTQSIVPPPGVLSSPSSPSSVGASSSTSASSFPPPPPGTIHHRSTSDAETPPSPKPRPLVSQRGGQLQL